MIARRAHAAVLLLIALAPGPLARAQGAIPENIIPPRGVLDRLGLERNWYAAIPLRSGREQVLSISMAENLAFAQTSGGSFFAYDAESGRPLWSAQLGAGSTAAQPATLNSYAVFVSDGVALHALDRATGRELWKSILSSLATSSTGANEDRAFVGLEDGKLMAFDARSTPAGPRGVPGFNKKAGSFAWNWQTNAKISARPLPGGQVVAFASQDGKVYVAVDAKGENAKPSVLYRWPASGPIIGSMATHGTRTLLVPSLDGVISAVDLFNGKLLWSYATGAPIEQEPLVGQEKLFVINTGGALTALDIESGERRWILPSGADRLLAVGGRRVYARSRDGDLIIVGRQDGARLFDANATARRAGLNIRDYDLTFTNRLNDRIYLGTRTGLFLCLREAGQARPLLVHKADAHPFGYVPPSGDDPAAPAAKPKPAGEAADKPEGGN